MKQYLSLLDDILTNGVQKGDRTGTGTLSVFGRQLRFDLSKGFPAITTKKLHFKSIIHELLWLISGSTNIKYLKDNGVKIWDEWADENGDLGPVYGKQWRAWEGFEWEEGRAVGYGWANAGYRPYHIDQFTDVIERIKTNPNCRRLIVSAWNVADVPKMKLPPCHCFYQFYVADGRLSCQMYQRSADVFLGVPFNIASYSLLTMMVAQVTGLQPGEFIHTFGDTHLYNNHLEQAREQLTREPRSLPTMHIQPRKCIDDFVYDDFALDGYDPHPSIKAAVSV